MAGLSETALFHAIRHPQKRAFLLAYSQCGRLALASETAKIHRTLHYHWLKVDAAFADAFEQAKELAIQALEDEAIRRAVDGSDLLLIFLLKGAKPEKYRERYEHSGPGGKPIDVKVIYE